MARGQGCTKAVAAPARQTVERALAGRVARSGNDAKTEVPSAATLAFFEFRGEGSAAATESCLHCGFHQVAHEDSAPRGKDGKNATERAGCPGFEPHGPWEFDLYYDGSRGWD